MKSISSIGFRINPLTLLLFFGIFMLTFILATAIVEGFQDVLFYFVISVVVITSIVFWKKAVIFDLYWLTLLGAVRKWLLPQLSDFLFFTPHIILLGVYLRFFGERIVGKYPPMIKNHPVTIILFSLLVYGVFNAFNPLHPDLRVGILGVIVHFYFVPLMFIIPYVFDTKEELIEFFKKYSLFSLPLMILGIKQFFSPVHSSINQYVTGTLNIATTGRYPRVTSTFAFISGYATYLNFIAMIMVYLLSIRRLSRFTTVMLSILLPLSIINLFMNGSRGPVGITLISIAVYLMINLSKTNSVFIRFFLRFLFITSIILVLLTTTHIGKSAYEGFMARGRSTEDIKPRLIETYRPFKFMEQTGLIITLVGYGIGSTYQGALRFVKDWGDMPRDFEEEPRRIVLELGVIGYILVYTLRLLFLILLWRLFKTNKDPDLKPLALCALLFQIQYLHFNNLVFNYTAHFFYWFFIGCLFLIIKLSPAKIKDAKAKGYNLSSR